MRKLRLNVDDLRVESFGTEAGEADGARGTVHARQPTQDCVTRWCPASVNPCVTRDLACFTDGC